VPSGVFRFCNLVEQAAALTQGKGYGAASIIREVGLVQSFLKTPPRLAIDVGGNIGDYTAELRRRNPLAEVHTFEPSTINIEKLSSRFANDSLVTLVPAALSDASGSATLFSDTPGSGLGSLSRRRLDHFNISFEANEVIKTTRFEEYWNAVLGNRQLDIVKLDIEGHELTALKGFGDALSATRILQFEFGGCNIDTRTYFQDFWYFFKDHQFDLYRITPLGAQRLSRYRESEESFVTTNYIAVSQSR
jgi:FkbM family methyltransferase